MLTCACLLCQPYHRTDPQKEAYFQQEDKKGGPTHPLLWFHDHYETILKDTYPSIEDYPLYKYLKQFSPSKDGFVEGKLLASFEKQQRARRQGSCFSCHCRHLDDTHLFAAV